MTDLIAALWGQAWEDVLGGARHEVRDSLNGLAVNIEVMRSRLAAGKTDHKSLAPFAEASHQQLQNVIARMQAVFYMGQLRNAPGPGDVARTVEQFAALLVPAAKSKGMTLEIEGYDQTALTSARPVAVGVALAAGFKALLKEGGVARCVLESGPETVVRFSHESADVGDLDPAVASALGKEDVRVRRSGKDLHIAFPGNT